MKVKVSIIGAGNVGSTTAHLILQSGIANVILYDITEGLPQGKALDLSEAAALWNVSVSCKGTNSFTDTSGSDIVVITAGLPRKHGMSRDDLLFANAKVVKEISNKISRTSPEAIVIVVTNPMDVMAQLVWKTTEFSCRRIIGMGGVLDSSRFRTFISMELGVSSEDIEALVLGGHGDQMVPLPRFTTIKGISIIELIKKKTIDSLINRTKNGGAEIVGLLKTGSAYYAPASAVFQMVKSIILDEKRMLACAAYLNGEYGIKDIYVGVPVILSKDGVEKIVEVKLSKEEKAIFRESCTSVRKLVRKLSI